MKSLISFNSTNIYGEVNKTLLAFKELRTRHVHTLTLYLRTSVLLSGLLFL